MGALSKLEMKTRKHHLVKKETESDSSIQGAGRILSRKRKRKEIGALSRLERDIPGTLDQKKKIEQNSVGKPLTQNGSDLRQNSIHWL